MLQASSSEEGRGPLLGRIINIAILYDIMSVPPTSSYLC